MEPSRSGPGVLVKHVVICVTGCQRCLCMLSRFSRVRCFATLWTVALQTPLSLGSSRQGYWSGLPCPPSQDLPNPGMELTPLALQADSLPLVPPGMPY